MRLRLRHPRDLLFVAKGAFRFWQALGLHVVPNHYYEPVPDTRSLGEELWDDAGLPGGIDWNEAGQLTLLRELAAAYKGEYDTFAQRKPAGRYGFYVNNGTFGSVDAEVYYGLIRRFRPRRILEIGSGYSTLAATLALERNQGTARGGEGNAGREPSAGGELIVVDPHPARTLRSGLPGPAGLVTLVPKRVQDLDPAEFARLGPGDILFIDSSHVLKIGSDVHYLFLRILPALAPGVLVHLHDIFLPQEYPRRWVVRDLRFFNEQYLLQAFLTFNDRFEVLLACNYLHTRHTEELAAAFGSYDRRYNNPGSFWIRRVS